MQTIFTGILFAGTAAYGISARMALFVRNVTTVQLFLVLCVLFLSGCATLPQQTHLPRTQTRQPASIRQDCPPGAVPLSNLRGTACWPIDSTYAPVNCGITVDDFGYKFWDCSVSASSSP